MYAAQHVKPRQKNLLSRRGGCHAAPSTAAKTARRSAPIAAIAGAVLGAAPAMASTRYTVRPGDTLSAIAQQYYGNAGEWPLIARANSGTVPDANLIYPGQDLLLPSPGSGAGIAAPPAPRAVVQRAAVSQSRALSGQLGCGGLEQLWEAAGGPSWAAQTAASVAMAESGGNQYAASPTDDFGYWQIHGSWGPAMATFDPAGNAKAAVYISARGSNWNAWTTYTSGAYSGRC